MCLWCRPRHEKLARRYSVTFVSWQESQEAREKPQMLLPTPKYLHIICTSIVEEVESSELATYNWGWPKDVDVRTAVTSAPRYTSVTSPGSKWKYVLKCDYFLTFSICVVMASVAEGSRILVRFPISSALQSTLCHLNDKCEGCRLAFLMD